MMSSNFAVFISERTVHSFLSMSSTILPALLLCLFLCTGCQTDTPLTSGSSNQDAANHESANQDAVDASTDSGTKINSQESEAAGRKTLQGAAELRPVTPKELSQHLARFANVSVWHYKERTDGELAGTWVSQDGDRSRLVFDVDGAKGTFSEDFNGNMTAGLYAISDDGLIATYSKWNGTGLRSRYKLDGQTIVGTKGPNPSAKWKRVDTSE